MWTWVGFLPGLKRVSFLPNDDLCKDSIGALREMVKTCIPTITKQALRYELGVSRIWTLTNSQGEIDSSPPNLKACVCFKK
jgi:hypothetical protein